MGVKSLWSLLTPVGRPVMLETMEGKVMAIDSSIWIYQFQATVRDKDGRVLVNAHVLGFLRRISKLLFYGIKPVFIFDGGAPALKRNTLRGRKEKKSGAAASHAKLAERLLAAQMRREALDQMDGNSAQRKGKQAAVALNDQTVYLEDVESTVPKTPTKQKTREPTSSSKKNKFYDHDPYRLPEVDMDEMVAHATKATAPDPRLATEDELRAFIEEMRPEDFDVTSPAFRELPTEVQYEIVGDLRLKSRQTSYARLQKMLRNAPTPLDFSKQQIENLRQRNTLTQQLLITTDSIGSAHISIPVRIASERNKQYVLVKNESASGGWILGVRDEGTQQKPIKIDMEDEKSDDSDEEMEEVEITKPAPDPDLREFQRSMALSTIGSRAERPKQPISINRKHPRQAPVTQTPLFNLDDDDLEDLYGDEPPHSKHTNDSDDDVAIAIQASFDDQRNNVYNTNIHEPQGSSSKHASTSASVILMQEDDDYASTSRLDTVLTFANSRSPQKPSIFGRASLLSTPKVSENTDKQKVTVPEPVTPTKVSEAQTTANSPSRPVTPSPNTDVHSVLDTSHNDSRPIPSPVGVSMHSEAVAPLERPAIQAEEGAQQSSYPVPEPSPVVPSPKIVSDSEDDDMEEVIPVSPPGEAISRTASRMGGSSKAASVTSDSDEDMEEVNVPSNDVKLQSPVRDESTVATPLVPIEQSADSRIPLFVPSEDKEEEEEVLIPWSRSPSPSGGLITMDPLPELDPVDQMDLAAEETDYAQFLSQVRGRNIDEVRRDIDEEISVLNAQRKAAMRDSEDVTQQMVNQIMAMLRLFGIPYMTAPMEAEAQCAELVTLGLVDGVITDDSDVFLFGAQRVFKNMFNQSKTVECFLSSDLGRELGLDRDVLVNLAYLLGSDYTDGLPGVGPVVAMEILKEFPGEDGLVDFRDWWMKVQKGQDKEEDTHTKFRKKFKKKFKDLFLTEEWPNLAVRDAYINPTVDSSNEPFKWGLPDLDALRDFFKNELGWGQAKVDDVLLPIIQKMNKRNQAAALNKQSNLNGFLDIAGGSGTHAPRKRQAYTSKRLQEVVNDFRKKRGRVSNSEEPDDEVVEEPVLPKKRKKATTKSSKAASSGAGKRKSVKKSQREESDEDEDESVVGEQPLDIPPDPAVAARLRPRPKPRPKARAAPVEGGEENLEV